MALVLHFLRHAAHDGGSDRLVGRMPGVSLSERGRAEAQALATMMAGRPLAAVLASPQPRTRQTADAVAAGRRVEIADALDEIAFGRWQGESFAELETDPDWRAWNGDRDRARTPGGETMAEVGARVAALVDRLRAEGEDREIALVSHLDVIRAYLCRTLDLPHRAALSFEIATASLTTLVVGAWGAKLVTLNRTPGFGEAP